jgi:hypothetical protein
MDRTVIVGLRTRKFGRFNTSGRRDNIDLNKDLHQTKKYEDRSIYSTNAFHRGNPQADLKQQIPVRLYFRIRKVYCLRSYKAP